MKAKKIILLLGTIPCLTAFGQNGQTHPEEEGRKLPVYENTELALVFEKEAETLEINETFEWYSSMDMLLPKQQLSGASIESIQSRSDIVRVLKQQPDNRLEAWYGQGDVKLGAELIKEVDKILRIEQVGDDHLHAEMLYRKDGLLLAVVSVDWYSLNGLSQHTIQRKAYDQAAQKQQRQMTAAVEAASPVVQVFPNPSDGIYELRLGDFEQGAVYELIVTDINGKEVLKKHIDSNQSLLDLSTNAKGVYFLKIREGSSTEFRQLVLLKK